MQPVNAAPVHLDQQQPAPLDRGGYVQQSDLDLLSARVHRIERRLEPFAEVDRRITSTTHQLASGLYNRPVNGADAFFRVVILNEPLGGTN